VITARLVGRFLFVHVLVLVLILVLIVVLVLVLVLVLDFFVYVNVNRFAENVNGIVFLANRRLSACTGT